MSGFAYRVREGKAERLEIKQALACDAELVWVHLTTNNEHAVAWLIDEAKAPDYIVDSLTATETRPRCDALGEGAFLNLRGRSSEAMTSSDPLASVRIWAMAGRVISVTRRPLTAIDEVVKTIEGGKIRDPGDLIAEFATDPRRAADDEQFRAFELHGVGLPDRNDEPTSHHVYLSTSPR